jgi:ATP-dependent Clp protease ATP-binding subunit ClpA
LGEASVDKTGVIEGLTCVSIKQRVSSLFHRRVLVGIEAGALRSDTNYRGDLEINMVGIVAAGDRYRDLVFFIDEIHALVGAGSRHPNILNRDEIILSDKSERVFFELLNFEKKIRTRMNLTFAELTLTKI